jgi:serine/threonine-protein kinase
MSFMFLLSQVQSTRPGTMIVAGRYELGEPLGAGGEARVFRAHDRATGEEVAMRIKAESAGDAPLPPSPPTLHPGWVRLLDRGVDPACGTFVTCELLRGETLGARVSRQPLATSAVLEFARQALDAVGALHAAGWVHGDLNADNFLFHEGRTWKLLELPFHHGAPPETRSALFGSIYTLAPEQIAGRPPDTASDLFALGCLSYYAASGHYPHGDGSGAEIAIGRLRFAPAPLGDLAPHLPARLGAGIMRLLARDPVDRPPDAAAACQLLGS